MIGSTFFTVGLLALFLAGDGLIIFGPTGFCEAWTRAFTAAAPSSLSSFGLRVFSTFLTFDLWGFCSWCHLRREASVWAFNSLASALCFFLNLFNKSRAAGLAEVVFLSSFSRRLFCCFLKLLFLCLLFPWRLSCSFLLSRRRIAPTETFILAFSLRLEFLESFSVDGVVLVDFKLSTNLETCLSSREDMWLFTSKPKSCAFFTTILFSMSNSFATS